MKPRNIEAYLKEFDKKDYGGSFYAPEMYYLVTISKGDPFEMVYNGIKYGYIVGRRHEKRAARHKGNKRPSKD